MMMQKSFGYHGNMVYKSVHECVAWVQYSEPVRDKLSTSDKYYLRNKLGFDFPFFVHVAG